MHSSARRQTSPTRWPATRIPTVCVVDPQADDYQDWHHSADAHGVQLRFVASAEEALRLVRTHAVDLWVVNTELPGLSGFDLCDMLKARTPVSTVYLVADEYSPEAERAAWRAKASLFGCKGDHLAWTNDWVQNRWPRRAARSPSMVPVLLDE